MKPGNLIIQHAAQLATSSGSAARSGAAMADLMVIPDGALIIEAGRIKAVGPSTDLLPQVDPSDFHVIDAAGRCVVPGFVDSHTHFVFAGHRAEEFAWRLQGVTYLELLRRGGGILNTVKATRRASHEELLAAGQRRLDAMLAMGVTTVEGKSGYGLDLATEIKQLAVMAELDGTHAVDVVSTFLGAHAVPPEYRGRADEYIDWIMATVLPEVAERRLARCCDVFCEKGVFSVAQSRRLLVRASDLGLLPKLHADEMAPLGGAELAAELGALSADHLLQASEAGIASLAAAGVTAVLLPGTAFSLREPYAPARHLIDMGCAVALATDFNPGSCFSHSVPLIMALAVLYMGMSPEEALTAFTLNGAAALGRAGRVGSLEPGKAGDALILDYPSYHFLTYHTGMNCVVKVIKNGSLVHDRAAGCVPAQGKEGYVC